MAPCSSVHSFWSRQGGSRQTWMGRGTCSMNPGLSPPLSTETSAARRSQKLTALEVSSPWSYRISLTRENLAGGGKGLGGLGQGAAEATHLS